MPLQLRIKMPGMQEGTVIALQLVEADWIPDCDTKLFEEFTREALELLSFQPEDELLLAPLREDFDAELVPFFDKAIDWRLLEAVRACEGPTLWEIALKATDSERSQALGQWFSAVKDAKGPLAQLPLDGFLAMATYADRRFRLVCAWPVKAAECPILVSKRKNRAAPGDGSLLAFYRERYGLEASDLQQCVLEAGDGTVLAPVAAATGAMLSTQLRGGLEACGRADEFHFTAQAPAGPAKPAEPAEPGPIRLLPEFLRPHPLSQSVTLLRALKLLPLLLQKLKRLDAMAELGALLADLLEYKRHPESKRSEFTFLQPFQTRTYDGRRHALEEERRLLQRLSEFQVDHADQDQETASHLLSKVEMEWILEVATTGTGAEEPYDFTRLAWLGDAVVFSSQ